MTTLGNHFTRGWWIALSLACVIGITTQCERRAPEEAAIAPAASATGEPSAKPDAVTRPTPSWKEVLTAKCSGCHEISKIVEVRHTPLEWKAILDKEIPKVSGGVTESERLAILRLLIQDYRKQE